VALVLETSGDSDGGLSVDASSAFADVADKVTTYRWPAEEREAFFATSARLHAKCVVADRSAALVTSANLTSAGINDNIELGVLVAAGPLPAALSDHFDGLVRSGVLVAR
jgi:cardiolipin synthase A/B